eukprot:3993081-Pyramimonas_sp.AAC.1
MAYWVTNVPTGLRGWINPLSGRSPLCESSSAPTPAGFAETLSDPAKAGEGLLLFCPCARCSRLAFLLSFVAQSFSGPDP